MEFRDVVEKRVSVRQFRTDPVPPADVREMVRLASLAPSPNNQQPWRFIAVTRSALLRDMAEAVRARVRAMLPGPGSDDARGAAQRVEWFSTFFAEAPLVVAVTRQPYTTVIDGALADSLTSGADINAMRSSRCWALRRPSTWRRWWRSVCRRQRLQLVTIANHWTSCSGSSTE